MMRATVYWPAGEVLEALEGAELEAAVVDPNSVVWIDFEAADDAGRREVSDFLARRRVHPLIVEDCLSATGRAKLDEVDGLVAVFFHGAELRDGEKIEHVRVAAVLGESWIATVRLGYVEAVEAAWRKVARRGKEVMARGPDAVLHSVADDLVDDYVPILRALNRKIATLEADLFRGEIPEDFLERAHELRSALLRLRHIAVPQREILAILSSRPLAGIHRHNELYFRDVYDHALRAIEAIDLERALLGDLVQVYFALHTARLNEVMKALTVITAVLLPPTLIAGIYGMNFQSMPELAEPWGYPAALAAMAFLMGGMLFYFRRRGWI